MINKSGSLVIDHGRLGADLRFVRFDTFANVYLDGPGFTADRILTVDDLREIRDWINTALASVEPHTEGVGA